MALEFTSPDGAKDISNEATALTSGLAAGSRLDQDRVSDISAEDTGPLPRVQAQRAATLGVPLPVTSCIVDDSTGTGEISSLPTSPIENATKNDIKAYLETGSFKCVAPHDFEQLSEFAYTPTDKGFILSVEKPFSNANFKRMKSLLRRRVKPSRYLHSLEVSDTAAKMAMAYGVDARVARMAGLLHDWDKALTPKRLRDRIAHYGLDIDGATQINMPYLLHGPTAAAVLADEFPEFGPEIYQAIERHTVGVVPMMPLDMIIFCADKIEPSREETAYHYLYDQIGKMDLEEMFLAVLRIGFTYLLETNRPLDVRAVEVWNYYCAHQNREA